MGTSAAENIAVRIDTTADISGAVQARSALGAVGVESEKLTAQNDKLTVSQEQMRAALAATGGDLQKAAQMVAVEADATAKSVVVDEKKIRSMALLEATALKENTARELAADAEIQRMGRLETAAYAEESARTAAALKTEQMSARQIATTQKQAEADAAAAEEEARAMGLVEAAAYKENAARTAASEKSSIAAAKVSGSARTASNALGIMTQAALTGNGSLAGMATAAGGLATGLSSVTNNAKLAAGAAGIGALVTVGVLLYETYKKAKEEVTATVSASFSDHVQNVTISNAKAQLAAAKLRADQATAAAAAAATGDIRDILPGTDSSNAQKAQAQAIADYEALVKGVARLRQQERDRAIELAQSSRDQIAANRLDIGLEEQRTQTAARFLIVKTESDNSTLKAYADRYGAAQTAYQLSLAQIDVDQKQGAAAIQQQFRHRDASGQIVALTAQEVTLRGKLLEQNDAIARAKRLQVDVDREAVLIAAQVTRLGLSENLVDRTNGRLIQIETERRAEIDATSDVVRANETAEAKKQALYRDTAKQASDDAKTIFDVFRSSSNSTLKAIGTFGENLRRVVIGAKAAEALVDAAKEGAAAIASAAAGDFRGAALHGAAAVQFGAAAALGARESLGGGGTGGAGGGGGGGGGGSTFTPASQPVGGVTIVNLITSNPYSRENIAQTSYVLQRNGTLNVPVYPTNGLSMVPG